MNFRDGLSGMRRALENAVLILEDARFIRELLSVALEEDGY